MPYTSAVLLPCSKHGTTFNTIVFNIMANFKNLEMAQALLSHNNLRVQSTLFGLKKRLVYVTTGSPVKAFKLNYHADAVAPLQRIIESQGKELAAAVKAFRAKQQALGNVELDACVSQDKNFVALQLLQFGDEYAYHPISDTAFFEGEQAQLVAPIL